MTTMYYGWDQAPSDFDFDPEDAIVALFRGGLANGGYGGYFYRADKEVYADVAGTVPASEGGGVKLWRDLSGNGAHLTTKFGVDPLYRALGGRSVQFNGAQSMGVTGKTTDHSNFELFLKIEGTGVVDNNGPRIMYEGLGNTANNDGFLATDLALVGNWNTSQFALWGFVQKALNTPGGGGMTAPGVYNVQKRGSVVTIFKDGTQVATLGGISSTNPAANASRLVIGASSTSTAQNSFRPFTGRYGAILRFDGELTDVQRQLITDFMTNFDIGVRYPVKVGPLAGTANTGLRWISGVYVGGKIAVEANESTVQQMAISTGKGELHYENIYTGSTQKAAQAAYTMLNISSDYVLVLGQNQITQLSSALTFLRKVTVGGTSVTWLKGAVRSSDRRIVVVGSTGAVAYSDNDGNSWTVTAANVGTTPKIAWCESLGKFIAVGGTSVSVSSDGITWTTTTVSVLSGTTHDVTWSAETNTLLVIVDGLKMFRSKDGVTFTQTSIAPTTPNIITRARYVGGAWDKWVVTGYTCMYISNDDGLTWTSIPMPATAGYYYAAIHNPADESMLLMNYTNGQYCFAELT